MTAEKDHCVRVVRPGEGQLFSVSWSPDGTRLAFGANNGVLGVLTAEGYPLWRCRPLASSVRWVAWSPDGTCIASASHERTVRIWDAVSGSELFRFDEESNTGAHRHCVCWSPNGRNLAWGRYERPSQVRLAEASRGAPPRVLAEFPLATTFLDWSPDGRRLALGVRLRVLDATTGTCLFSQDTTGAMEVRWSPDGLKLAAAFENGRLEVWDVDAGRRLLECKGHDRSVNSLDWSPDGRLVASAGSDRSVRLWSAQDGREVLRLDGHEASLWSVRFALHGTVLASAGEDGTIRLWDVSAVSGPPAATGREGDATWAYLCRQARTVGRHPRQPPRDNWVPHLPGADPARFLLGTLPGAGPFVALAPDGRTLCTARNGVTVQHWDLGTGPLAGASGFNAGQPARQQPDVPRGYVTTLALSPEGGRLAVGMLRPETEMRRPEDTVPLYPEIAVLDASARRLPITCSGHRSSVDGVCWSPDGTRLASASWDETVRVWEATSGRCLLTLEGHTEAVLGVAWSPDGLCLASASFDGTVRLWETTTGAFLGFLNHGRAARAVDWSSNGRQLASGGSDGLVCVWDVPSADQTWPLPVHCAGHSGWVYHVAFSPDGRLLASISEDGTARIWEASSGRELRCFAGHHTDPNAIDLCWAPSGAFLVTGDKAEVVRVWDLRPLQGNVAPPTAVSVSPTLSRASALPAALARLVRVGLSLPLGLLRDLLSLTGGPLAGASGFNVGRPAPPVSALAKEAGVRALSELRWPEEARVGLAALLLGRATLSDSWRPPADLSPAALCAGLERALAEAEDGPADPYPVPLESIRQTLRQVDDRLLMLLRQAGPRAVAADPALPLRLLVKARLLPPASARPELAAAVLRLAAGSGPRSEGSGVERSGLGRRGPWRSLLPWQLALPGVALAARQRRGELLFRVGQEAAAVAAGPLVLILDVSPACYGPVEAVTRACAWAVASAWIAQGEAVWLLAAGGATQARPLRSVADLTEVWLLRSAERVQAARALTAAARLRAALAAGGEGGRILLLSHPWFGWDEEAPACPGLRGLFARAGGRRGTPIWASACERWAAVPASDIDTALAALQEILR